VRGKNYKCFCTAIAGNEGGTVPGPLNSDARAMSPHPGSWQRGCWWRPKQQQILSCPEIKQKFTTGFWACRARLTVATALLVKFDVADGTSFAGK